jgi:ankyrin repeat protein
MCHPRCAVQKCTYKTLKRLLIYSPNALSRVTGDSWLSASTSAALPGCCPQAARYTHMLSDSLLERLVSATVLHIAAAAGLVQMVVHLVKAGPRNLIDKQTRAGFTAAALAALGGHTAVLKALLTLHCDTSVVTADGATLLHLAVESGDPHVLGLVNAIDGMSDPEQQQVS